MSRHVLEAMGTVFSLDIRDGDPGPEVIERVAEDLHWVDRTFSTYRADSEVSRLGRGDVRLADCSPEVAAVLDLCADYSKRTGGYFSATAGGRLDPTGLVKGWSIQRVYDILTAAGLQRFAVNGGGDVATRSTPDPTSTWRIGITDPHDRNRVLTVVAGDGIAVATSGSAERGAHIVDPFTGAAPTALAAVTVVGRDIISTDVYATAAFAMGTAAFGWLESLTGYAALLVDGDGRIQRTSGFARYEAGSQ